VNWGGVLANVNFGSCDNTLENPSWDTEAEDAASDVTLGPESCSVTADIPITGCETVVPGGQTFEDALTYTNVETAGKTELTIHVKATGRRYAFYCGSEKVLEAENGTYEGTLTAKAYSDAGHEEPVDLLATPTEP
jgi:hypothetical protein